MFFVLRYLDLDTKPRSNMPAPDLCTYCPEVSAAVTSVTSIVHLSFEAYQEESIPSAIPAWPILSSSSNSPL